jgi:hypothetical protein
VQREPPGGDPQRERQATARGGDRPRGAGGVGDPWTDACRQQVQGIVVAHHVEGEVDTGGRKEECPPARDDHRTAPGARQQRLDLRGVPGVVAEHEDTAAGEQAAVVGGPLLRPGRDGVRRCAQCPAQLGQDGFGLRRGPARTAQCDVQHPVREVVDHRVRGMQRQCRLADARLPVHQDDHGPDLCGRGRPQGVERHRELPAAADVAGVRGWELGRRRRYRVVRAGEPAVGQQEQVLTLVRGGGQHGRQQLEGHPLRTPDPSVLDVVHGAHAEAGPPGHVLLAEPGGPPKRTDEPGQFPLSPRHLPDHPFRRCAPASARCPDTERQPPLYDRVSRSFDATSDGRQVHDAPRRRAVDAVPGGQDVLVAHRHLDESAGR